MEFKDRERTIRLTEEEISELPYIEDWNNNEVAKKIKRQILKQREEEGREEHIVFP